MTEDWHSTSRFAQGRFEPHGVLEMGRHGNILVMEAAGPFNGESLAAFGALWESLFRKVPWGEPYANIVSIRQSLLASPDFLAGFEQFLSQNTEKKQVSFAIAWIIEPDTEGARIMLPVFQDIYERAGRNFRVFDTRAEAEAWIEELQQGKPQSA